MTGGDVLTYAGEGSITLCGRCGEVDPRAYFCGFSVGSLRKMGVFAKILQPAHPSHSYNFIIN
jgi:hypothetical protein